MFPDIFNSDAFSLTSLTATISNVDHVPGRAGELAFTGAGEGVSTLSVAIEQQNETLTLVPTTPRHAPAPNIKQNKRTMFNLGIPQVKLEDTINAASIQGVRAFGSTDELIGAQTVINQSINKQAQAHDLTLENLRLGALRGEVLDADGSTLVNLFTLFGVTQPDDINFYDVFLTPEQQKTQLHTLRTHVQKISRFIKRNAKSPGAERGRVWAFCGDNFFDNLVESTRFVWDGWAAAERKLGDNYVGTVYEFAGVMWENYAGTDDASDATDPLVSTQGTVGIAPDECQFFLTGVPGLYAEYYAPADFMETANTIGLPRYAKVAPDRDFNRFVKLHTQQNVMPICTRPRTLLRGVNEAPSEPASA